MSLSVADSDDDAEELSFETSIERLGLPDISIYEAKTPGIAAMDGTNEHTTGSIDQLRKQIQNVERHLFDFPVNVASSKEVSSMSTAAQARKRRSTSVVGFQSSASPEKTAKRSKTMKDSLWERHFARTDANEEASAAFHDANSATTYQTAKFTEHSDNASSHALPTESIQTDFINHEPVVMFKDTGDTVADGASSQNRMVEAAFSSKKGLDTSAIKSIFSDEVTSSSFPWPASEGTPAVKEAIVAPAMSSAGPGEILPDEPKGPENNEIPHSAKVELSSIPVLQVAANEDKQSSSSNVTISSEVDDAYASNNVRSPANTCTRRSCPRVEVFAQSTKSPNLAGEMLSPDMQRSIRGRKREPPQELTMPVNSDGIPVALPKDSCQPRPCRRRATQLAEEVIECLGAPEKALKAGAKRRKTEATATSLRSTQETLAAIAQWACPTKAINKCEVISPKKLREDGVTEPSLGEGPNVASNIPKETSAQSAQEDSPSKASLNSDEVFVKPAPKQKSSSKAKSKRAHTTIFEDHIEFSNPQRRLTLSQQQAARTLEHKSKNDGAGQIIRQRKGQIVYDANTDEHEIMEKQEATSLLIGNVPKVVDQASTVHDTGEVLLVASTANKNEANENASHDPQIQVKSVENTSEDAVEVLGNSRFPKEREKPSNTGATQEQRESTEIRQEPASRPSAVGMEDTGIPVVQALAFSPEQPSAAESDPIPNPITKTVHSPIRCSSKAAFRVGLSKKQRIPPLLRMMKPQKK